eukprot:14790775-Ditylum_brightwellii.AAC.1
MEHSMGHRIFLCQSWQLIQCWALWVTWDEELNFTDGLKLAIAVSIEIGSIFDMELDVTNIR